MICDLSFIVIRLASEELDQEKITTFRLGVGGGRAESTSLHWKHRMILKARKHCEIELVYI